MNTIQVVLAAANPRGTTQLQLDEELRRIEVQLAQAAYTAAQAHPQRQAAHLRIRAVWASQLIDLVRNVTAFTPSVVHFSGHGEGPRGLVMAGEASRPLLIPSPILREVLAEFVTTTRLVVLNACHSAVQAEQIRQVIPCVVAMKDGITDQGAAIFAAALYGQLALGCSVGRAFRLARAIMAAHVPGDADIPDLQCRNGSDADTVYLVTEPRGSAEPEWKTLIHPTEPTLSLLRRAINLALPKDVDLEAFVQDRRHDPRYARVHREWGVDMQRQRKLSLLFDYGPGPREIKADLLDFAG